MIDLTPKERAAFRALAHPLHPVVTIGQHGLTPSVLHEIDVALTAHELIKVRVHSDDRDARSAMLASIAQSLAAAPVQHLGKLLVLWRPRPAEEVAKPAPRPAKRAKAAGTAKPAKTPKTARTPTSAGTARSAVTARTPNAARRGAARAAGVPGEREPLSKPAPRARKTFAPPSSGSGRGNGAKVETARSGAPASRRRRGIR